MEKKHYYLRSILKKISFIDIISDRHGGLEEAIADEPEGLSAILMNLVAIAEQFENLKENGDFDVLQTFDKDDIRGLNRLRNKIAHHYDEVIPEIITGIISSDLPRIKKICEKSLHEIGVRP